MAKITCGVNSAENSSFDGMTIAQVMEQYGQFLNIPSDNLVILVNDEEESDTTYVIQSSDEVEFVKSAGEKGRRGAPGGGLPRQAAPSASGSGRKYRGVTHSSLRDIHKENIKRRNCPKR